MLCDSRNDRELVNKNEHAPTKMFVSNRRRIQSEELSLIHFQYDALGFSHMQHIQCEPGMSIWEMIFRFRFWSIAENTKHSSWKSGTTGFTQYATI